jgi:hypothetical protein
MNRISLPAAILVIVVLTAGLTHGGCRKRAAVTAARKRFALVDPGGARLQLRGVVETRDLAVIANPYGLEISKVRRTDGEKVAVGDVILELDAARIREDLSRRKSELRLLRGLTEREDRLAGSREQVDAVEKLAQLDAEIRRTRTALAVEEILAGRGVVERTRPGEARERLSRLLALRETMAAAVAALERSQDGPTDASRLARILDLERAVAEQERTVASAVVRAPAAGLVRSLQPLRPGATQPGPLLSIFDPSALRATATLWQNQFLEVDVGTECILLPDFMPERKLRCRVASKVPYGARTTDPASGMDVSRFTVQLELLDPSDGLLPGMAATVTFPGEAGVFQVPKAYVGEGKDGRFVLVEREAGAPERVTVQTAQGWEEGFVGVRGLQDGAVLLAVEPARGAP